MKKKEHNDKKLYSVIQENKNICMQNLFSSTHTLKVVFDIVLDNLVRMNMCCDNIL